MATPLDGRLHIRLHIRKPPRHLRPRTAAWNRDLSGEVLRVATTPLEICEAVGDAGGNLRVSAVRTHPVCARAASGKEKRLGLDIRPARDSPRRALRLWMTRYAPPRREPLVACREEGTRSRRKEGRLWSAPICRSGELIQSKLKLIECMRAGRLGHVRVHEEVIRRIEQHIFAEERLWAERCLARRW